MGADDVGILLFSRSLVFLLTISDDEVIAPLTTTEQQVVRLIALGCSVKDAAAILGRSRHTVDNHKTKAMKKLGARNAALLTRCALRLNLTTLNDDLTAQEARRLKAARKKRTKK